LEQHSCHFHGCDGLGHGMLKNLFKFVKLGSLDDLSHQQLPFGIGRTMLFVEIMLCD